MISKNKQIKAFEAILNTRYTYLTQLLDSYVNESFLYFSTVSFETFTYDRPYNGDFKNLIFCTYNDHYRGNSPFNMSISNLHHPNLTPDDRGYIKGVVLTLDMYLKLRYFKQLPLTSHSYYNTTIPKFRKSLHSLEYSLHCHFLLNDFHSGLNTYCEGSLIAINSRLRELTGCSLLYYINDKI